MTRAILLMPVLLALGAPAVVAAPLLLLVDPDGTTYLGNGGNTVINFNGYEIASPEKIFDAGAWNSIRDQYDADPVRVTLQLGTGAENFGEMNDLSYVAEVNLIDGGLLQPYSRFAIGRPYSVDVDPSTELQFRYTLVGSTFLFDGSVLFVPEPSTLLLAALAGLGLLVMRLKACRRAGRS